MINIIPKPLELTQRNSKLTLKGNVNCKVNEKFTQSYNYFKVLFEEKSKLHFNISDNDAVINFILDDKLENEEYKIVVDNEITISASTDKGAFYAIQSLRQICELDKENNTYELTLSKLEIHDKPRFKWRSFMLDEARHFFGMETVKTVLDIMAMLKMNVFHWHLTEDQGWRIEIEKYPLLTEKGSIRSSTPLSLLSYNQHKEPREMKEYGKGCYYTKNQVREIVDYAKKLHIDIVPEIDMPGHLVSAIACYPELSCTGETVDVSNRWGVMDNIGCCGKDNIYQFAKDVIDELVELFPFEYFHIGGDEVPKKRWEKCPNCQKKIKELGLKSENELQGYFNNQILNYLHTKNKHMIGWNEILEATQLSDDTIVQWWTNGKRNNEIKWISKGNKVILSKVEYVYFDHFYDTKPLSKTYSFDLESLKIDSKYEKNVLGIEAPQWTEYVRDRKKFDLNTFPRLHAIAEIGWTSKENKNYPDFKARLKYHEDLLEKIGIGCAHESIYEPKGFTKFKRVISHGKNWIKNPNIELTYQNK